jgi:hypothetical protein
MRNKYNIQIVDSALNALFDIYQVDADDFFRLFPSNDQEIEFSEDFFEREGDHAQEIWNRLWKQRLDKNKVVGIHATLFCGMLERKPYFPTKRWDESVVFPDTGDDEN